MPLTGHGHQCLRGDIVDVHDEQGEELVNTGVGSGGQLERDLTYGLDGLLCHQHIHICGILPGYVGDRQLDTGMPASPFLT